MSAPPRTVPILLVLLSGAFAADLEPPIYEVRVEFQGNDEVPGRRLREALGALLIDMRRSGVNDGAVDDAVYELERSYAAQGYRRAKVQAAWSRKDGTFTIGFRILEGPRSIMEDLVIQGNLRIPTDELKACFDWPMSGLIPGLRDQVFTERSLADGEDWIVTRYQIEGYYYARTSHEIIEEEPGRVRVRVGIIEGPRIVIEAPPIFLGALSIPEGELLGALDLTLPAPFNPRLPIVLKGKLIDFYRNRSRRFVEVDVEPRIDPSAGEALLIFRIREGPVTRIGTIAIQGNERTEDGAILQRVRLRPGDLYREDGVQKTSRSLIASGLFSSVQVETVPVEGEKDEVDLTIGVNESPRFRFTILAGYGSYEMLRGSLVFEDVNLFRIGHKFRAEARGSFKTAGVSADYTNPFFFHEDLSQSARTSYERREHPSFTEVNYGGETGWSHRPTRNLVTRLFYRIKQSQAQDVSEAVPDILVEDVFLSSIYSSVLLDRRNNFIDPDRGGTYRASVEYAGGPLGSEIDFVRTIGSISYVLPLGRMVRLVGAVRVGAIPRLADTEAIPIQERFFLGGESTIRSYSQDEAGPEVDGEPIGGEAFTAYNVELRFPLLLLEGLQGAAFADIGTLNERVEDIGRGRQFIGLGYGIRYVTPVGPFRLDMAFNPDRRPGEDQFVLHFALGYPF